MVVEEDEKYKIDSYEDQSHPVQHHNTTNTKIYKQLSEKQKNQLLSDL